jgi:hypothetical protein
MMGCKGSTSYRCRSFSVPEAPAGRQEGSHREGTRARLAVGTARRAG